VLPDEPKLLAAGLDVELKLLAALAAVPEQYDEPTPSPATEAPGDASLVALAGAVQ